MIRRRIEVLDWSQHEQNTRGQEQAQRAQELERRAQALEERARLLDQREPTLATHERTAAEVEASLRLREEATAERDRITLAAKASADRCAEELRLREEACREWDAALAEREAEMNRREVASRRLGEQLAKCEEAVARREARHLESARTERAAIAARASELEAREKDLAAGGQPGGAGLVSQLAMAQNTLADLERLVQDQAGEIAALRLTNEIGPGQLSDAVDRLERAGPCGPHMSSAPGRRSTVDRVHRTGEGVHHVARTRGADVAATRATMRAVDGRPRSTAR